VIQVTFREMLAVLNNDSPNKHFGMIRTGFPIIG